MKISRDVFPEIIELLELNKIVILKGARQVGKTTLMKKVREYLSGQGKETFYISADEDFENAIFKTPAHFIARLESDVDISETPVTVFIDEFQYIENAGRFIKVLHDKYHETMQFVISGSSSLELTKNTEFMTGRKIEIPIKPISFTEYVRAKTPGIEKAFSETPWNFNRWRLLYEVHGARLEILFAQYTRYGAYPEIVSTENRKVKNILIRELFSTYIQKDIIAFLKIKNVSAFNNLLKLLCAETACLLNKDKLSSTLGISINTLKKYLDIVQGTYLCRLLPPFFTNIRKEISKMPKVFFNDNGLRNYLLNRSPETYDEIDGRDAENLAYIALNHHIETKRLFYYRTISKAEIDFIVDHGEMKEAIEVKFRNKVSSTPVVMQNFAKNYPTKKLIIITKRDFRETEDALFIPLPLFEFYLMRREPVSPLNVK